MLTGLVCITIRKGYYWC